MSKSPKGQTLILGLTALATGLTLLTGVTGYAADKITLVCSGTVRSTETEFTEVQLASASVIIDPDRGIVTAHLIGDLIFDFSISKLTENSVSFKGSSKDGHTVWQGVIDRFSGAGGVTASRNNRLVTNYVLNCKRANPLF